MHDKQSQKNEPGSLDTASRLRIYLDHLDQVDEYNTQPKRQCRSTTGLEHRDIDRKQPKQRPSEPLKSHAKTTGQSSSADAKDISLHGNIKACTEMVQDGNSQSLEQLRFKLEQLHGALSQCPESGETVSETL
jgi:hypothetical protein